MTTKTHDGIDTRPRPGVDSRVWWAVLLPAAGVLLGAVALTLLWAPRLPGDVANQWANGQVSTVRNLAVTIAIFAGPAAAAWAFLAGFLTVSEDASSWVRRSTTGALTAILVTVSLALPVVVSPSLVVANPWTAPDPGVASMAIAAAVGVIAGIAAGTVVEPAPNLSGAAQPPTRAQVGESSVLWERSFTAPLAVAVFITGLVLMALGSFGVLAWGVAVAGGVLAVLGIAAVRWTVTITHDEVTARPLLGFGGITVERTAGMTAATVAPRTGLGPLGWGVQVARSGEVTLALGGSPMLRVIAPDGVGFSISVPGADEAAEILNRST